MKIEKQVCSLRLAKRLKELGVKQKSIYTWTDEKSWDHGRGAYLVANQSKHFSYHYSAFTVAELGEILPVFVACVKGIKDEKMSWGCIYEKDRMSPPPMTWATTEADAKAEMLIYLLENKLTAA